MALFFCSWSSLAAYAVIATIAPQAATPEAKPLTKVFVFMMYLSCQSKRVHTEVTEKRSESIMIDKDSSRAFVSSALKTL
jgi:hypothetical protein